MYDIKKVIVFLFVVLLLFYMIRLSLFTRRKWRFSTHTFSVLLLGLLLITTATFFDMIMPIIHNHFLQIVIRICFTLGAVIYIIGVILWSNYTKKVIEKFEEQSLKDSMTDVFNRKGMEKIYKMLSKENSHFYVFMCDLDRMKKINDKYGHLEGDKYIANTAKILADTVGKRGYVGRVGGDEFVVILEYLDMQQIEKSILSIKQRVHGIFSERNTGISIGYAVYPDDGASLEDLIKVADKKMYKDKESTKLYS